MLLDISKVSSFADYFVICSGESNRQLRTIYEEIEHLLKKEGARVLHREGAGDTGWFLLDYGDVVVHIFGSYERELYNLEELWSEAPALLRVQ